jgi:hypothetical protein
VWAKIIFQSLCIPTGAEEFVYIEDSTTSKLPDNFQLWLKMTDGNMELALHKSRSVRLDVPIIYASRKRIKTMVKEEDNKRVKFDLVCF